MNRQALCLFSLLAFAALPHCQCGPEPGDDASVADTGSGRDGGGGADAVADANTDARADSGADAGADGGGQSVVSCEGAPVPSVGEGACEVVSGGASLILYGTLLTPGRVYHGGAVQLDSEGTISCVGCECTPGGATQVLCNGAVITPGLINAHDHIGWMGDYPRAAVGPSLRYEHRHDWRKGDRADDEPKISASGGANADEKAWGELRFILGGGTSVNGSGSAAGLIRNLDVSTGLEGLDAPAVEYSTFPLGDSGGTLIDSGCGYPGFDPDSVREENAYTPHVGEGINDFAHNEFLCLSSDANGGRDLLGANTAIIHGIGFDPVDIALMAAEGQKLIWSPRSNVSLYGETAPVTLYHQLGVPIALGTDWIPSGSMNVLRELACADLLNRDYYGGYFTDQQLWRMVTIDAARAMGMSEQLGVLSAGAAGDIAVFRDHAVDPYGSVVRAEVDDLLLVLRGGQVLAGRAEVVAALADDCDPIDVCGASQRVCLQREVGKGYAALEQAGGQAYGLFYCEEPDGEPTCVPYRGPGESVLGSTVYPDPPGAGDRDGDGLGDGGDNCPDIFNPVRPMDHGVQGDFDHDGVGDLCDPCPLDADTTTCERPDPDDLDRDGTSDFIDNCPGLPNDQADRDEDGKGDPCDPCPDTPNPGVEGCPSTVTAIQDATDAAHPAVGARVGVECVVSAVASDGLWCQEPAGGPYSGIFVFTRAAPLVTDDQGERAPVPGDPLKVDATYTEYYDLSELNAPSLSLTGPTGQAPAPATVAPADVATGGAQAEAYEGVLVKVLNVVVTRVNPDDPDDYDEFEVTGGLRVDDKIYAALDNTFDVGTGFTAITGPLQYSYGNFKLLPRDEADLAFGPPSLAGFDRALSFQREGAALATVLPGPLMVGMTRSVDSDTVVSLTSASPQTAAVPAEVTIPSGERQVEVQVRGVAASATPVRITASHGGLNVHTDVRILSATTAATLTSLLPEVVSVGTGRAETLELRLDLPAPTGGSAVALSLSPALATVPATVTVPFNAMAQTFTLTAGETPGEAVLSATLGGSHATAAVTVLDPSEMALELGGWRLVQTDSARDFTLPEGTQIAFGQYLIVARNASQADFEAHWGVTLGDDVVFIDSGDLMPVINGDETLTLTDPDGLGGDGPSFAMPANACVSRKVPVQPAGESSAWTQLPRDPGAGATPGSGQTPGALPSGAYISEICDASGGLAEFVEIYFDGMP